MTTSRVRVELPHHLQTLARTGAEVSVEVPHPVTAGSVLDAIEARYPMLCGTVRDHVTKQRRPFVRYFACQQDLSHQNPDVPLPAAIADGSESFVIWGALAGG